jgi:hypothetical protein
VAAEGRGGKSLSRAVFLAARFGAEMPLEAVRVLLAREFGWTLEYVDSLDIEDVQDVMAVLDGLARASSGSRRKDG